MRSLTTTAPTCRRTQVDRDAASIAMRMKYSSHDGRITFSPRLTASTRSSMSTESTESASRRGYPSPDLEVPVDTVDLKDAAQWVAILCKTAGLRRHPIRGQCTRGR